MKKGKRWWLWVLVPILLLTGWIALSSGPPEDLVFLRRLNPVSEKEVPTGPRSSRLHDKFVFHATQYQTVLAAIRRHCPGVAEGAIMDAYVEFNDQPHRRVFRVTNSMEGITLDNDPGDFEVLVFIDKSWTERQFDAVKGWFGPATK
jgi:hypothetical protein